MFEPDLPDHRLLTVTDITSFLRISKPSLRTWVADGRFPAPLIIGGRVRRWRRSDVVAFLDAKAVAFA
jgi:excisionase family DNA binding protein